MDGRKVYLQNKQITYSSSAGGVGNKRILRKKGVSFVTVFMKCWFSYRKLNDRVWFKFCSSIPKETLYLTIKGPLMNFFNWPFYRPTVDILTQILNISLKQRKERSAVSLARRKIIANSQVNGWHIFSHFLPNVLACIFLYYNNNLLLIPQPLRLHCVTEPVFINVYGAPESIPRNEFRQPM